MSILVSFWDIFFLINLYSNCNFVPTFQTESNMKLLFTLLLVLLIGSLAYVEASAKPWWGGGYEGGWGGYGGYGGWGGYGGYGGWGREGGGWGWGR